MGQIWAGQPLESVDAALAFALSEAAKAAQWAIVAQLSKELEARRLAGSNVATLDLAKKRR